MKGNEFETETWNFGDVAVSNNEWTFAERIWHRALRRRKTFLMMRIAFDPLNDRFNFLHDVDDDLF